MPAPLCCILLRSSCYSAIICTLGCCLCLLFMASILALSSKVGNAFNSLVIKKLELQRSADSCWDLLKS